MSPGLSFLRKQAASKKAMTSVSEHGCGILVVTWNFPPRRGGMETLVNGLCRNLKKRYRLFVITAHAPSAACEDWICRAPLPGLAWFFLHASWRGLRVLSARRELKIVLGGSALVAPLVVFLAKALGRKAVVLVHGSDVVYPSRLYQQLCVRWLRKCHRVIANSRYTAELVRKKRVPPEAISVVPPGIDADVYQCRAGDVKRSLGLEGKKVILCVGRLAARKGIPEFVERCLPRIVAEVPDACLVIVGGNPKDSLIHREDVFGRLNAAIQQCGLESHVRLVGWLDGNDLTRMYDACDLIVLPVLAVKDDVEGFGIVLLEAAATGKPCVATRTGGVPDAVEDAKSGVLTDPADYEAMSRSIIRLLRDDQLRRAMGEFARARALQDFGWETIVKRYEGLFDSLR